MAMASVGEPVRALLFDARLEAFLFGAMSRGVPKVMDSAQSVAHSSVQDERDKARRVRQKVCSGRRRVLTEQRRRGSSPLRGK